MRSSLRVVRLSLFALLGVLVVCAMTDSASAGAADGRLDFYFIDVEGGAALLIVSPIGESFLIDSGYPDNNDRDLKRILNVAREVARLNKIDHAFVSHWHLDHYGNHAALAAQIPIKNFWDRGIPDALQEDKGFHDRIVAYRSASQNQSKTLRAGDRFEYAAGKMPLKMKILTASREVIENSGQPNPYASEHEPMPEDRSDNAASVSMLLEFGKFRFLCCGDLTWNEEARLVIPNNPVGQVDLFQVTHHGLGISNNPVLVKAIDPVVSVMCNGEKKGGNSKVIDTLRSCKSLQDQYQLHRNVALKAEEQAPAEFIANDTTTADCQGVWIKASIAPDGNSYTVQIGADGQQRTYHTRTAGK